MTATLKQRRLERCVAPASPVAIPPRMRVLYITTRRRTGSWLAEALSEESDAQIFVEEAIGSAEGLTRLREDVFDIILVSHLPGEIDALDLTAGYRTGGANEPIIVLGAQSEQEMASACYEAGADGYVCVNTATTCNLLWVIARSVQRHQLQQENQRLSHAEQARLKREHAEADRLIREQRAVIGDLEAVRYNEPCEPGADPFLPRELLDHYRELLRTYVIMGSGNLGDELKRLADLLVTAGMTARQTMQMHLHVVEEMIHGLGTRSSRHVMTRADLLVLEVVIHLAEGYRQRYRERSEPLQQLNLPGF